MAPEVHPAVTETTIRFTAAWPPSRDLNDHSEIAHDLDGGFEIRVQRENDRDIEEIAMRSIYEICRQMDVNPLFSQSAARKSLQRMREHLNVRRVAPSCDLPAGGGVAGAALG